MIYVEFTGRSPIRYMDGMVPIFIMYDWTTNAILATPVKNMAEEMIVSCFKQQITYLTKRGSKPILNIIDNVASKAVQAYVEADKVNIKLVEPHNHRVNVAERAIQTFNNHLIAGLSTCNDSFPSLLWNKIVPQAQDSLNILRTSRVHPKLSAYSVLEGIHNFNRQPWAPPGTRATIFNLPETRTSFGPRAIDTWYIGPAPKHYRCYNFFFPSTGGIHTSGQATFYPQHCTVPKETPMDETICIVASLIMAIQRLRSEEEQHPSRHTTALEKLADIFNKKTGDMQMMDNPTQQISTQPTAPAIISTDPHVHQLTTRGNTTCMLTRIQG